MTNSQMSPRQSPSDTYGCIDTMPTNSNQSFENQAKQRSPSLLKEFLAFLRNNKKWWLLPIVIVGIILGFLLFLGSTGVAPFIYTLF